MMSSPFRLALRPLQVKTAVSIIYWLERLRLVLTTSQRGIPFLPEGYHHLLLSLLFPFLDQSRRFLPLCSILVRVMDDGTSFSLE